jgi:1,4-alpha-glucan branching enzyme
MGAEQSVYGDVTGLSELDLHLFNQGKHFRLHKHLGAHAIEREGVPGVRFAVWAPGAKGVSVIGDFNGWDKGSHPLLARGGSGIWEGFIPSTQGIRQGTSYKYHVYNDEGWSCDKADPVGFHHETPPHTASKVWGLEYDWADNDWMTTRAGRNAASAPMSIYEVHLGSWRRVPEDQDRSLSYREIAHQLAEYAAHMGFTHVELLPIMEHPFYGSWGYQTTGYFAPTSRYGTPQDFKYLIDVLHQHGVGVILDWVPSHFPEDDHGLASFDGTHLYEHADPRQGFHPDWKSAIFNYGRHEVRSFLISSALYWLEEYHIDGLRVDAVASMLYLDYSRKSGEWIPNKFGGRENLEAIHFLQELNREVYASFPDVQTIAEESTAWPNVSRPTYVGGLGFGMKWDMGWMHDTLAYLAHDPIHRRYHHNEITFRAVYQFSENYVMAISHDEVVHGKGSLVDKMPGDAWQRFANLRLLFGNMYSQPGKKLVFMGCEFGQQAEWNHDKSLAWHQTHDPLNAGLMRWIEDLNRVMRAEPALHATDFDPATFAWIDASDQDQSIIATLRSAPGAPEVIIVCNFTPSVRHDYRVGAPRGGVWREALNSDAARYGGSNVGNNGQVIAHDHPHHGRPCSISLTLPPLAIVLLVHQG